MKIEREFSPITLTLETELDRNLLLWMAEFAMQTVRAERDPEVKDWLKHLTKFL